jgi:hypothetical protein
MSALNKAETAALHDAFSRCSSVASALGELEVSGDDKKRIEAMRASLKKAHDEIKTVWNMKGHYG